jgi:transposase
MTHPGVGPITALAFVLIIGSPDRFRCSKQIASYLGLIPRPKTRQAVSLQEIKRRAGHYHCELSGSLRDSGIGKCPSSS